MKRIVFGMMMAALIFAGCTIEESDPCDDTEATDINVSFRVVAYNIDSSVEGALYSVSSEKHPCGADPKGQFDISGWIDASGTFESSSVNYNLRNTEDVVVFDYWFNGIGSDTIVITYDMAKAYDGLTYYVRVNSANAELQVLRDQYDKDPSDFRQCQDLPWALVTGSPKEGGTADKTALYTGLKNSGYVDIETGVSPEGDGAPTIDFEDGDIIMLNFDDPPGTEANPGANHYAVVYGGQLYQILNWPQGGEFDGPRNLPFFFQARRLTNPFTGETSDFSRIYQYYKVWRKASTANKHR